MGSVHVVGGNDDEITGSFVFCIELGDIVLHPRRDGDDGHRGHQGRAHLHGRGIFFFLSQVPFDAFVVIGVVTAVVVDEDHGVHFGGFAPARYGHHLFSVVEVGQVGIDFPGHGGVFNCLTFGQVLAPMSASGFENLRIAVQVAIIRYGHGWKQRFFLCGQGVQGGEAAAVHQTGIFSGDVGGDKGQLMLFGKIDQGFIIGIEIGPKLGRFFEFVVGRIPAHHRAHGGYHCAGFGRCIGGVEVFIQRRLLVGFEHFRAQHHVGGYAKQIAGGLVLQPVHNGVVVQLPKQQNRRLWRTFLQFLCDGFEELLIAHFFALGIKNLVGLNVLRRHTRCHGLGDGSGLNLGLRNEGEAAQRRHHQIAHCTKITKRD